MAHATPITGFLITTIRSHDLRRGATQDTTNLEGKIKGHATDTIAEYLGHNDTKTTKHYIRGIRDSIYTIKVEENFQDPFYLIITDRLYVKRRRLNPAVITKMYKKDGLNPSVVKNRAAISKKVTAESWEAWAKEASESFSSSLSTTPSYEDSPLYRLTLLKVLSGETVDTVDSPTTPSDYVGEPSDPKPALLSDTLDFDILPDNITYQNTTFNNFETSKQFIDPTLLPSSIDQDNLEFFTIDEIPPLEGSKDIVVEASTWLYIDPRLLTSEIGFEDLAEANSEQPTAAVKEAYFDKIVSQAVPASPPKLLIDGTDFVRFFSKINVSTNQVLA